MKFQLSPFFIVLFALAFAPAITSVDAAEETALDTATIEAITGLKGVSNHTEGTFKISKPRNDVAITVEQVRMAPFMGLTSWATFAPGMKDRVMVMGDMVLFEDEGPHRNLIKHTCVLDYSRTPENRPRGMSKVSSQL